MVYNFVSDVVTPPVKLFMGIDKYENEDLIKWGWPEDVWFHVDKVSSAHVYLRLNPGQTIDDIPPAVLEDACQLVKENSISGSKMPSVDVVYTMWSNLKKTDSMEVGEVAFYVEKEVRKMKVEKKTEIVKRLNKTKKQETLDFRGLREERDRKERAHKQRLQKELEKKRKEEEKEEEKRRKEEAELRCYSTMMQSENMTSNVDNSGYDSDDFM